MKQPEAIDVSFLHMETPQTPMHAGSLCLFELPPGRDGRAFHDDFKAHVARRLHLAPIFGKLLSQQPPGSEGPTWVDAERIDLDHHVRRISLPRPGTARRLEELVGRLHSNFLDRSRPLWESHVIEGLQAGRVALYAKMHHAAIDGDAGAQLTQALFDATAEPREVEPPSPRDPSLAAGPQEAETPTLLAMIGTAQSSFMRQQVRALQMIPEAWQAWTRAVLPGGGTSGDEAEEAPAPQAARPGAPRTTLNGTVTSQRSYAARSLPLDSAERVAERTGTRLDDVVLAACSAGLRAYLDAAARCPRPR